MVMGAAKWVLVLLTAGLVSVAGSSCSRRPDQGNQVTVCFAFQDLETEFWVAAHQAIAETLKSKGIQVVERNANEDANKQLEQIRATMARGVSGIIIIPQDGESAVTIVGEANRAGVPIGVFNRPPANDSNPALVVVADNEKISEDAVSYMAEQARQLGRKVTPLILVGDLGDSNAVARRRGFMNVIEKNRDVFHPVIEVPTKWDAATAQANLEAALQRNPDVDFIFTSSDFMYPQIRAVLEPLGKWKRIGEPGHVILGGVDGDTRAAQWMKDGYVDATGVQDLFYEADVLLAALLEAIEAGDKTPKKWMDDPGFALTQANLAERARDMWGFKLLAERAPAGL
jgi:ABC-type sugar transport system substrate-binding protein